MKYTMNGSITVSCATFGEPEGLRGPAQTAVEIVVADSGCGIPPDKLENIFREFEQVESSGPKNSSDSGVGKFKVIGNIMQNCSMHHVLILTLIFGQASVLRLLQE